MCECNWVWQMDGVDDPEPGGRRRGVERDEIRAALLESSELAVLGVLCVERPGTAVAAVQHVTPVGGSRKNPSLAHFLGFINRT
jgi:hypothetical protein